jgi:hypothetical protein
MNAPKTATKPIFATKDFMGLPLQLPRTRTMLNCGQKESTVGRQQSAAPAGLAHIVIVL